MERWGDFLLFEGEACRETELEILDIDTRSCLVGKGVALRRVYATMNDNEFHIRF